MCCQICLLLLNKHKVWLNLKLGGLELQLEACLDHRCAYNVLLAFLLPSGPARK